MTFSASSSANTGISSVPAVVTFWLLAIWSGMIVGLFHLVEAHTVIEGNMLAVLTGLIGTQTTLLVAAVSFWVGSTVGARQAQTALANDTAGKTNALAQLAGAGPPPPADPTTVAQT